ANAYAWLERYPEAVTDLEAALALDETAGVLETDVVDDAYFSALLGAAKAEARTSMEAAERTLARYKTVLPGGRHLKDAAEWPDRLRAASGGERRCEVRKVGRSAGSNGESRRSCLASAAPA